MALNTLATVLFALAVLHTFSVKYFRQKALRYPEGSIGENFFHLLGEVEVVFGLWSGVFVLAFAALSGVKQAVEYVEGLNFTEPIFVFIVMTIASTRPVLQLVDAIISAVARLLPFSRERGFYVSALVVGPLLGSAITEPAAMTVTALLLRDRFFSHAPSPRAMYVTLATLFVNVSVGGGY